MEKEQKKTFIIMSDSRREGERERDQCVFRAPFSCELLQQEPFQEVLYCPLSTTTTFFFFALPPPPALSPFN